MPDRLDSLMIDLFEPQHQQYRSVVLQTLKSILPAQFFEKKETKEETQKYQNFILQQVTPLITHTEVRHFPGNVSFFALSKLRQSSFKFFFEMISRWLAPGRRLSVVLVYASDFQLPELNKETYSICEVIIRVNNAADYQEILSNFPIIESEIRLGIGSEFYAQRILEIKGLSADDKIALIHGFVAYLIKRFPHHYDSNVFTEMQQVLVTCHDDFKAFRHPRHLSRIISIQYLFRKALREAIKKNSQRRYTFLKIFRAFIQTPTGRKRVLSVIVGVNILRDQESFGEKHLLKAIQHYIPSAMAVERSFFAHKLGSENSVVAYIEVEKKDGSAFTAAEILKLRSELPTNLTNRIEHRLHNVFMPRNEEEVMRNILTLTTQIKYVRDIPQVLITFDEQAYAHLYYTVILARLLKPESLSIVDLFKHSESQVEYLHDRTKIMGYVRKKYPKEASVFRLKLPKEGFLRSDHSIDLYKARQSIVKELSKVLGEVRDFNGGMISKQSDLLTSIRLALSDLKEYDDLLLENFFYSLAPVVAGTFVDPQAFKTLFMMLLEGIKEYKQEGHYLKLHKESFHYYALLIAEDYSFKDSIHQAIQELQIPSTELISASVKTQGNLCFGYICSAHDTDKKEKFLASISQTLDAWVSVN